MSEPKHKTQLTAYAKEVLLILERDEEWSPDTIDEIGRLAIQLGLARADEHGLFKYNAECAA